MSDFVMPSLGADMESGTLLEWLVKPGDAVKRGDIVAVVDTSKAEIEVEIFEDGMIGELLVGEGERVRVGTALARVVPAGANGGGPVAAGANGGGSVPAPAAVPVAPPTGPPTPTPQPLPPAPAAPAPPRAVPPPAAGGHRLRVSPLARRTAEQLGVDLAIVSGTGPNGAITRADVQTAAHPVAAPTPPAPPTRPPAPQAEAPQAEPPQPEPPQPEPPQPEPPQPEPPQPESPAVERHTAMREAIATLMARSKREIPHYYLETQIDVSRALDWLHEENLRRPVNERLLSSVLLLSAVAHAVAEMPEMNGFWIDGGFRVGEGIHLGVAISLRGGGLIAPALHDADRMSLDELMAGVRDLVARARAGRLRSSEMSDPTITVTNLGERGVDLVHGVIYPPQVALVGFGGVHERPVAVEGMLAVRPIVIATLAADHRASDGHTGSRLMTLIDHRLQEPERL